MSKQVHIMHYEKFIGPFIDLINENFDLDNHFFIIIGNSNSRFTPIPKQKNIFTIDINSLIGLKQYKFYKILKKYTKEAEKIVLHGLFQTFYIVFFYLNQKLLKRCYWLVWGGDLYFTDMPKNQLKVKIINYMRRRIYKKVGFIVTGTRGDYILTKKWFGAQGKHVKCFSYPSNIFMPIKNITEPKSTINILVGNSRDPSNNHVEIFNKLLPYKDKDIKIFVPLSYGPNLNYSKRVIKIGKKLFGNKFIPITDFVTYHEYLIFLSKMDIGIFNHKRQQAFSNIITLLGMGKKVYINEESTLNGVYNNYNLKVFNVESVDLNPIDKDVVLRNCRQVEKYFSEDALIHSLKKWLN